MLNLDKHNYYLLACSCGPDSMALFFMLLNEGYKFDVAHVNYHLRKESINETEILKKYCEKNDINLYIKNVDEKIEKNIEEKCREIRYEFFAQLSKQKGYCSVLVAHQQDDFIETYLLQKKRRNLPKYYGISKENVIFSIKIERPLLSYTKQHLLDICNQNNVPFCIDSSNNLNVFERNKIRHEIVEKLTPVERVKIIHKINEENKHLTDMFLSFENNDYQYVKNLLNLDKKTFAYYLNYLLNKNGCSQCISIRQSNEIMKVLLSTKTTATIKVNDQYYFAKEYEKFRCYRNVETDYSYVLDSPSQLETYFFYSNIGEINGHGILITDYPITISNRYSNKDKVRIKDYEVEIRRLYIDWKMPLSLRKVWPIIRNKDNKIIFVPRYRSDFVYKNSLDFYVKCVLL